MRNLLTGRKRINSCFRGFTLLEMAIVIMIVGLLIAPLGKLYSTYLETQQTQETAGNIGSVSDAIGSFMVQNGRYPCPASLADGPGDPNYGREMDCSDRGIAAVGSCTADGGVCVEESVDERLVTLDVAYVGDDDVDADATNGIQVYPRVRRGGIPFKMLNIPEEETFDANGKKLSYVVTERLAVADSFNTQYGGISIVDGADVSIVDPPGSAHFIVMSHGKEYNGGWTRAGAELDCIDSTLDFENCDIEEKAVYRSAPKSLTDDDSAFDDVLTFYATSDTPVWKTSSADDSDIIPRIESGFVGIADTPSGVNMDTIGETRARQNAMAGNLCSYEGEEDCFPPELIAGTEDEGLKCQDGYVMTGIREGAPECIPATEVSTNCPPGQVATGFSGGKAVCKGPPPPPCPALTVDLCPAFTGNTILPQQSLAVSNPVRRMVYDGFSRRQEYECTNTAGVSMWRLRGSAGGTCTCSEASYSLVACPDGVGATDCLSRTITGSCGTTGDGMSGTTARNILKKCVYGDPGFGSVVTVSDVTDRSGCSCSAVTQPKTQCSINTTTGNHNSGASYQWSGSFPHARTFVCAADGRSGSWGPWEVTGENSCACSGEELKNDACLADFGGPTKRINYKRNLIAGGSAVWSYGTCSYPGGWTYVDDNCECSLGQTKQWVEACPAGYTGPGKTKQLTAISCDPPAWGPVEQVEDECEPIVCIWKNYGVRETNSETRAGQKLGEACPCGDTGNTCYTYDSGRDKYTIFNCRCEPG